jgi:hypothetical protein
MNKASALTAEEPAIDLNPTQAEQIEKLTDRFVDRNPSDRATARRLVQIAVLTRGIASLKKELGA